MNSVQKQQTQIDEPIGVIVLEAIDGDDSTEATTVNVHALGRGPCRMGWAKGDRHPYGGVGMWANMLIKYCSMTFTRRNEEPGISRMCGPEWQPSPR